MGKGNLLQGQGSGKVGDVVFMVRQGQQVSRVYTESGARSGKDASEASRIQRVKFGSASNQWNLYRYVCTRMYRSGKTSKQSDYNYFVKRNQHLFPYLSKQENLTGVHVLQPGTFSDGNLGRIELVSSYTPTYAEGQIAFYVHDVGISFSSGCDWSSNLSALKTALQSVYPSARKVTYLISIVEELNLAEAGISFLSQNVNHYPVIIDLYAESTQGENEMTVSAFFSSKISSSAMQALINAQTAAIAAGPGLIHFIPRNQADVDLLGRVGILVFASDDNVSDCYTTTLPQDAVNPTAGVYAAWASYRTSSSLRIAADSYGYQSGVMRDDIAKAGNDISAQVSAYAARLAQYDEKASAAFLKSVGDVSQVQAKVVRKSAEEK